MLFFFFAAFMVATFIVIRKTNTESANIKAAIDVIMTQDSIMRNLKDLDTAKNRFIATGSQQYLTAYYAYKKDIRINSIELKGYILDDEKLNEEKSKLSNSLIVWLENSTAIIKERLKPNFDSIKLHGFVDESELLISEIEAAIFNLDVHNKDFLANSNLKKRSNVVLIQWLFILMGICVSIILYIYYIRIIHAFEAQKANETILRYNASLIGNISDPIITTNNEYKITNWNKHAEELFGYTEEDVLGKEVYQILFPKTGDLFYRNKFKENKDKNYWRDEIIYELKNGKKIYTKVSASTVSDFEGELIGTVAVFKDITGQKFLQYELEQLTTNLQMQVKDKVKELSSIFERITDAFIALDNNWNYTYVNEKAASMHGKTGKELIGKNIWELFPETVDEEFYVSLHKAKETQESQNVELFYSITGQWFQDLIYPSENGISVYYHDITDKKNAELAMLEVNQKLNYHINNTPLAVVEFDKDVNILQWSNKAEEIFGWSSRDMIGKHIFETTLVYPEDLLLFKNIVDSIPFAKENSVTLYNRNIHKNGSLIYCEWYNSLLRDSGGNIIGMLSLIQDVTKRKQVELELLEAESKFRNLVEKSMVGVYITQGVNLLYSNPTLNKIFGFDTDEPIERIVDIVEDESKSSIQKIIEERNISEGDTIQYQFKGKHKTGRTLDIEVFGTSTIYQGNPAIIGTLIDVTESRKLLEQTQASEKALKESNERFELVTKATNEAIWDLDLINNKVWGNDAYRNMFKNINANTFDTEYMISNVHPEDVQSLRNNIKDAVDNQRSLVTHIFRYRNEDGAYRVLDNKGYLLFNADGVAFRMLGAIRDITEERAAQQRVLREKNLSDALINSLPGIFYLYNQQGQFYRWNTNLETIAGYSSEEISNFTPFELFFRKDHDLLGYKIASVFEKGEDEMEAELRTKAGKGIQYYFNGKKIMYEGESCLIGCGIDISEKVKSQEKLKESEEKFRSLIEQAADGIFISDENGRFLVVNSSLSVMTGYSMIEMMDMERDQIFVQESDYSIQEDKNTTLMEMRVRRKNDEMIMVEINSKQLFDGTYQGIVRNITERKRVEEDLKNSEQKYRLLFYENPMPMFMVSLPNETFIDVNKAANLFYGYKRDAFLKMVTTDLVEQKGNLEQTKPGNTEREGTVNAYQVHKKKNGELAKVNIISHNIIYEGKPVRLILAIDVTERILADEKLKSSHEQLRMLAMHMEKLREAERTHMAREIHDELGQQLTGLKMDISWLNKKIKSADEEIQQKMKDTIGLIDKTVITVRKIATDLRPSILDDLGLIAAMEWQSEEFQKRSEIQTSFESNVMHAQLPAEMATGVFRIYQESLTNVLRHSHANAVNAKLNMVHDSLRLEIIDNGKGFVIENIESKKTLGLLGMKERISLLGGSYEINSKPGIGTTVLIEIPL